MWNHMFVEHVPVAEKLLRTVLVYALVAVLIRITGKRGLAGLNTLDIAVVFLLSNVVQNAIIGDDNTVTGGAVGAVTLVAVNALLNRAAALNGTFARFFDGTPTTVIENGAICEKQAHRLGLRDSELEHAVRLQNGDLMTQVQEGTLEPGGQLVLTLRESEQGATKADVAALLDRLARIEAALAARPATP